MKLSNKLTGVITVASHRLSAAYGEGQWGRSRGPSRLVCRTDGARQ
ncbi:hypothetical protein LMG22037_00002 [Paraburkholderia phenoliruptrix]|uniref:Uncharacterized protein n=1 Tax=Paraburkholderia phenoliruptrix TaxID=252970 RepID=A0A6J4ZNC3_9BURK|nr:hypothetical protein LMG22037_00002 [Paraburkholderia phenoliruptrix]